MKGRNGPKWALLVLGLTVFLFYFGDRVFGQGTPKAAPDTRPDLPSAADQPPAIPQHTLTILQDRERAGQGEKEPRRVLLQKRDDGDPGRDSRPRFRIRGLEWSLWEILPNLFDHPVNRPDGHRHFFPENLHDPRPPPGERGHPSLW